MHSSASDGSALYLLVRHAHAPWRELNAQGVETLILPGDSRELSAAGHEAAEVLASYLARFPIVGIASSDSLRARQTVAPLARRLGLPVRLDIDLRERRLTEPGAIREGAAFQAAVAKTWQDPSFAHPGGESNVEAQRRGVRAVQRRRGNAGDGAVVVSTHGNLLTLVLNHYDASYGFAFWSTLTLPDVVALSLSTSDRATIQRLAWRANDVLGGGRIDA